MLLVQRLPAQPTIAWPGYTSPDQPGYRDYRRSSTYVEMPDGVALAVDVYLPEGGPARATFPVVLRYTPYGRSYVMPHMGPVQHLASVAMGLGWGPIYDVPSLYDDARYLLQHGYALVSADMRGTGASFGAKLPLMPTLAQDGKALVEWIAAQPWCDGQVGMAGPSYLGWGQYLTASAQPAALKCIMPEVIAFDIYTDANRPGGIAATRWLEGFSDRLYNGCLNMASLRQKFIPTTPVLDLDGDGRLDDEWPEIDSASLAAGTPRYSDGQPRAEHPYFEATRQHLDNVPVARFIADSFACYDDPAPPPYQQYSYLHTSPAAYMADVAQAGIPVYHVGGWLDGFTRGTTKLYATLAPTNPSRLLMGPRSHFRVVPKPYQKYLGYTDTYIDQLAQEQLRFFDRYLKNIDNGLDTLPPVQVYVMHGGWIQGDQWPLSGQQVRPYYLHRGQLATRPAAQTGADSYRVDPLASSGYGKDSINRWIMFSQGPKVVMDRRTHDQRCLIYETDVLASPQRLVGHPVVHLWVSSDQADGDFYVYLSEVEADGQVSYITEGQLRACWYRLHDDDLQAGGRIDVQPDLPWHGYRRADRVDQPLAGGRIVPLVFDLMPAAWQFRAGSRIRIAIAGTDAGNFEYNPTLCPDGDPAHFPETTIRIHHGPAYPSRIDLPLLPLEPDAITER
ncbi:MAG: CocE/NonD family hydrolase [Bacteroidia bacterium]